MEVVDAQMLDYSTDHDVHMQTTFPSPRPWAHGEASMEDDNDLLTADTLSLSRPYTEDVEVEMGQVFEGDEEYEMLDDDGSLPVVNVVDVDVVAGSGRRVKGFGNGSGG